MWWRLIKFCSCQFAPALPISNQQPLRYAVRHNAVKTQQPHRALQVIMAAASKTAAKQREKMLRGWEEVIMATNKGLAGHRQVSEFRAYASFAEGTALEPSWCTEAGLEELNHYRARARLPVLTLTTDDKGAPPPGSLTKPARQVRTEKEGEEEKEEEEE